MFTTKFATFVFKVQVIGTTVIYGYGARLMNNNFDTWPWHIPRFTDTVHCSNHGHGTLHQSWTRYIAPITDVAHCSNHGHGTMMRCTDRHIAKIHNIDARLRGLDT